MANTNQNFTSKQIRELTTLSNPQGSDFIPVDRQGTATTNKVALEDIDVGVFDNSKTHYRTTCNFTSEDAEKLHNLSVDTIMSDTSSNPIANKVAKNYIDNLIVILQNTISQIPAKRMITMAFDEVTENGIYVTSEFTYKNVTFNSATNYIILYVNKGLTESEIDYFLIIEENILKTIKLIDGVYTLVPLLPVDSEFDEDSENPIQNKILTSTLTTFAQTLTALSEAVNTKIDETTVYNNFYSKSGGDLLGGINLIGYDRKITGLKTVPDPSGYAQDEAVSRAYVDYQVSHAVQPPIWRKIANIEVTNQTAGVNTDTIKLRLNDLSIAQANRIMMVVEPYTTDAKAANTISIACYIRPETGTYYNFIVFNALNNNSITASGGLNYSMSVGDIANQGTADAITLLTTHRLTKYSNSNSGETNSRHDTLAFNGSRITQDYPPYLHCVATNYLWEVGSKIQLFIM